MKSNSRNSNQAASIHAGGHDVRAFTTHRPLFPHGTVATAARVLVMSVPLARGVVPIVQVVQVVRERQRAPVEATARGRTS